MIVVSIILRKNLIENRIFDRAEATIVLQHCQDIILRMKSPDLEHLVLNDFEALKKNSFFNSQEILLGKSICEICLSDPETIKESLLNFEENGIHASLEGSLARFLTKGD